MSSETLTASNGIQAQEAEEAEKVGVGAYISLFFAMCFFSGVFYKMPDAYRWLGAFDFTTLIGKFGSVSGAATFVGKGGRPAFSGPSGPTYRQQQKQQKYTVAEQVQNRLSAQNKGRYSILCC